MDKTELIDRLNALPVGYISKKTINGKERYYLQYRKGKKIVSNYVPNENVLSLRKQIDERKRLERMIHDYLASFSSLKPLSENAISLTGDIMEKDDIVASFKNGDLIWLNQKKAPLIFTKGQSKRLEPWLINRAIDSERNNSKILRRSLKIVSDKNEEISLSVHAATLIDDYWFRPSKSKLHWKDVSFIDDLYSDLALNGKSSFLPSVPKITPELTLTGSFEKCWKLINGEWFMIKKGTDKELFSEYFCSSLAKIMNIPTAEYFIKGNCIVTANFAEDFNFEPISSIAGSDDTYEHVFPLIFSLSKDIAKQYLILMYFDCLVNNVDRHNENYGLLRNRKNGKIVSLAPNFDNNVALTAVNGYPHDSKREKDGLIDCFEAFLWDSEDASSIFISVELPDITPDDIKEICDASPIKTDEETLIEFILNAQKRLKKLQDDLKASSI